MHVAVFKRGSSVASELAHMRIVWLCLALASAGTSSGADHTIKAYWILPDASEQGLTIDVANRTYRAKEADWKELIGKSQIIAQDNHNAEFWIYLKPAPIPVKSFRGLIVKGPDFAIGSRGYGASNEPVTGISLYANAHVASQIGRAMGVALYKRSHPGHRLRTRFLVDGDGKSTKVMLEITNVGEKPIIFQDGGMNRGWRNNQFGFIGFRDGKPIPDIGNPAHMGGLSTYVTLKKNEKFRKNVDLTDWFDLSRKGRYRFIGTYYMAFLDSLGDHRIRWADYVTSSFTFARKKDQPSD